MYFVIFVIKILQPSRDKPSFIEEIEKTILLLSVLNIIKEQAKSHM